MQPHPTLTRFSCLEHQNSVPACVVRQQRPRYARAAHSSVAVSHTVLAGAQSEIPDSDSDSIINLGSGFTGRVIESAQVESEIA